MFKFSESERIVENRKINELNQNLKINQNIKKKIKIEDNLTDTKINEKKIWDEKNINKKCSVCVTS